MPHAIEPASSGRAKCRGCGKAIAKGELRFGERRDNPYAEGGEMTLWFHLVCGAYKRPEAMLEALDGAGEGLERKGWLADEARRGLAHRRLPRVDGAERASSGRATCRSCRGKIPQGEWRIRLGVLDEGGMPAPLGFLHAGCAREYFGTGEVLARVEHFTPELTDAERAELGQALAG